MHRIDIVVGTEQGYVEFEETYGKAVKFAKRIVRNGYEIQLKGVTSIIPPHRIQRIDIYPVPERKQDAEERPNKDTETRKES